VCVPLSIPSFAVSDGIRWQSVLPRGEVSNTGSVRVDRLAPSPVLDADDLGLIGEVLLNVMSWSMSCPMNLKQAWSALDH
jgi:hypothetical protein